MRLFAGVAALAVLVSGPALAQTSWIAAPSVADMAAAYPAKARAAGLGGGADLVCSATRQGALKDCDVLAETPRGQGFGAAARRMAEAHLKAAGVTAGQEVRVALSFAPEMARGEPHPVKTPLWTALPSVEELQAAVPKTEGGPNDARVTLVCDVADGGVLTGCVVDREEPAGQGFGPAVLALAPKFRVGLLSGEGLPTVGGKVRAPVRFALKPVDSAAK